MCDTALMGASGLDHKDAASSRKLRRLKHAHPADCLAPYSNAVNVEKGQSNRQWAGELITLFELGSNMQKGISGMTASAITQ